jgi:hypothetical protein
MKRGFDGYLSAYGHERRRLYDSMRRLEFSAAGGTVSAVKREAKRTHDGCT